ncbi:MAG: hypothetical protein ACYDD6_12725 [Acidimicrobiales bacterium]
MSDDTERDEQALSMRDHGRSFAAIARSLGYEGALAANAGFIRALRLRPSPEQRTLRDRELHRLDVLATRVGERADLGTEEVARRMRGVERLRQTLG